MDIAPVQLAPGLYDQLVSMARSAQPNEMCGYLFGPSADSADQQTLQVDGVVPIRNAARSPTAFVLDPDEMISAERTIDEQGAAVVGVVHSHPTSAPVPSERDRSDALTYDPGADYVQLIVSMQGFAPRIKAWRIVPDGSDGRNGCIELPLRADEQPI